MGSVLHNGFFLTFRQDEAFRAVCVCIKISDANSAEAADAIHLLCSTVNNITTLFYDSQLMRLHFRAAQ